MEIITNSLISLLQIQLIIIMHSILIARTKIVAIIIKISIMIQMMMKKNKNSQELIINNSNSAKHHKIHLVIVFHQVHVLPKILLKTVQTNKDHLLINKTNKIDKIRMHSHLINFHTYLVSILRKLNINTHSFFMNKIRFLLFFQI